MTAPKYKKERRVPAAPAAVVTLKPAAPLSERERERIQETIPLVKAHFPELVDVIRDMTKEGLIHGWRNVHVRMNKNGTD